jgi:hypothetical protein
MLKSLKGDDVNGVPHHEEFKAVQRKLGTDRLAQVREDIDRIIDEMPPDAQTGHRTFSSSFLGSKLTPWPYPLAHLYDVAREILGKEADDQDVEVRAGLLFGLCIWECVMSRKEEWVFYDPNLSSQDPNKEIAGKVYFERGD